MVRLNLGCNRSIMEGYVNLDIVKYKGVNVVHDLNDIPYPFPDNYFDEICMNSILEHLPTEFYKILRELKRISKSGCIWKIIVPCRDNYAYVGDTSHCRMFSYRSFDAWAINPCVRIHGETDFGLGTFLKILKAKIIFSDNIFLRWINYIVKINQRMYDRFFYYYLPARKIEFEMEIL